MRFEDGRFGSGVCSDGAGVGVCAVRGGDGVCAYRVWDGAVAALLDAAAGVFACDAVVDCHVAVRARADEQLDTRKVRSHR